MNLQNGLLVGALGIMTVVAAVGWTRADRNANSAAPVTGYVTPYTQTAGYNATTPAYGTTQREACVENPVAYHNAQYYPQDSYIQSIHRPVMVRQYSESRSAQPEYQSTTTEVRESTHYGRSGKKSVAIVAGSAGVGAAVGALAGGGKGAGIGALAGGAGGFVYDRMTHNR